MARGDDLCAAIKTLLATASSGSSPTSIEQAFAPEHDKIAMSGKYVYLFSLPGTTVAGLSKAKELREFKVGIVIVERYSDPAAGAAVETVPTSWVQARKSWVETYVFNTLNSKNTRPLSMWPNRCEWVTEVDFQQLKHKIFWSEVEIDYREIADR